jgi:hypothetical protein
MLTSKLVKSGLDLTPYESKIEKDDGEVSTMQTSEQLDKSDFLPYNEQRLLNYST